MLDFHNFLPIVSLNVFLIPFLREHLIIKYNAIKMRFSKGRVCCYCNGTDVARNGKRKGVQRYLCRNCNNSFSDLTNSATYKSKKSLN